MRKERTVSMKIVGSVIIFFSLLAPAVASPFGAHYPPIHIMERYIIAAAPKYHINPNIALRVAHSEGLNAAGEHLGYAIHDPIKYSYGPFQLHMDGLGNKFDFGRHPTNLNWKRQVDYALNYASNNGWGSWYGAAKVGVGHHCGIRGGACGKRFGPWHIKIKRVLRHGHIKRVWKTPHVHRWVWHPPRVYKHPGWHKKH